MSWNLKHREDLLADIASGVEGVSHCRVANIRVRLYCKDVVVKQYLGLDCALDAIANDIYWDDEGNWSEADHAKVDVY